jgi:hypothetical protein
VPEIRRDWKLVAFSERFEDWVTREAPSQDLLIHVGSWIFGRADDPYEGAKRAAGFENLWFIPIPGAYDKAGAIVTCSYWIEETNNIVRCNSIAALNPPFL